MVLYIYVYFFLFVYLFFFLFLSFSFFSFHVFFPLPFCVQRRSDFLLLFGVLFSGEKAHGLVGERFFLFHGRGASKTNQGRAVVEAASGGRRRPGDTNAAR